MYLGVKPTLKNKYLYRKEIKMKIERTMKNKLVLSLILILSISATALSYSDVSQDNRYYTDVTVMSENGYINGYPDGSFDPDRNISAAELISVVCRVKGLTERPAQNGHWAGGLMQAALDVGLYDWDEIPPTAETYDLPISRQLAVKIIMKAFAPDVRGDYNTESSKIKDFSLLDGRYYESVLAAYSAGIVKGDGNGCFNPKSPLSRAEACALISRASELVKEEPSATATLVAPQITVTSAKGVSQNGRLKVVGTQLCNEKGEAIVLRGMSSHGIQWFPEFLSYECIKSTADSGANLFRVAMYTDENGYISNPGVKNTLISAVDTAVSLDMYVIIDWHILNDGNPNTYKAQAKEFFAEMAGRYKDCPAVLYEICNEPNGNVSWSNDVKPYAEEIISTIRAVDPNAVILVGSPTWSQDLNLAAEDPIEAENIMYTCHFYSGTHGQWLRDRISGAIEQGLPVFVSEWGTSNADGSGGFYESESREWLDFLDKNRISWANWSLCDKNETSAAVKNGADISDGIQEDELTLSGKFVFEHFN